MYEIHYTVQTFGTGDLRVYWMTTLVLMLLLIVVIGALQVRKGRRGRVELSPEERDELVGLPMTGVQKAAWRGLAVGLSALVAITILLVSFGVVESFDRANVRLAVELLFVIGLAGQLSLMFRTADERDRRIASRAPLVQVLTLVVTLVVWSIALTERFHEAGSVPLAYLNVVFGSVILISFVGQSLGVLAGYWMSLRHGEV
jgi:hypothetical protein